jgi:hypothetical protein
MIIMMGDRPYRNSLRVFEERMLTIRFMSPGIRRCVIGLAVTDVSKYCSAVTFRVKQSKEIPAPSIICEHSTYL